MSPEVGELSIESTEHMLTTDTDIALSTLAAMASATDVRLRELAQQLAARVIIDLAASTSSQARGVGKMRSLPMRDSGGDLDIDGSTDALLLSRAAGHPPNVEDLRMHAWTRPDAALAVLIDRSGSMTGDRLAIAAVAAAAAAQKTETDYCVVAFSDTAIVIKGIGQPRPVEDVIHDILRLRGFGPTDLSLAFRTAQSQLARSNASRQRTVILSDCRPTEGGPPERQAAALEQLGILAPADDCEDAEALAAAVGAKWAKLAGPTDVPAAFAHIAD
jgi:Mg-chelatase subunit ChlD